VLEIIENSIGMAYISSSPHLLTIYERNNFHSDIFDFAKSSTWLLFWSETFCIGIPNSVTLACKDTCIVPAVTFRPKFECADKF
jgi:hypothetical protein